MLGESAYEVTRDLINDEIHYLFVSEGRQKILKAVNYVHVDTFAGSRVFNLGFGNYDLRTGELIDTAIDNNGDHYQVFYTVLNTIPDFFSIFPDTYIMVRGSDSRSWFSVLCRPWCKKKCDEGYCKNEHRRIKIYRGYVDKNYDILSQNYNFYGGVDSDQLALSLYERD